MKTCRRIPAVLLLALATTFFAAGCATGEREGGGGVNTGEEGETANMDTLGGVDTTGMDTTTATTPR